MTKKSKVTVKTGDVTGSKFATAGRDISDGVQPAAGEGAGASQTEVHVELGQVTDSDVLTAGRDVVLTAATDLGTAVESLGAILAQVLQNEEQIADLRDMIAELQAQGNQPPEERNVAKLRRIIKSIGEYVGLATLTATQLQNVEALIEQIRGFLGF